MTSSASSPFNIAVLGLGGVGGFLGGLLAQSLASGNLPDARLYFLARGEHLAQIQKHGLILNTPSAPGRVCRPTLATAEAADFPPLDLALVCVKSYGLLPVLEAVKPKIREQTVLLPLLNGVDIYDRIRSVLSLGIVLPACIYVGSHIERPGVVSQAGPEGRILYGPDPRHPEYSAAKLMDLFTRSGIAAQWLPDPYPAIWEKFLFIAAFGLVTAFSGETLGEVAQDPELQALARGVMREILALASKQGIRLDAAGIETTMQKARTFPRETKTSYQRDLEVPGHPQEGDLFGGTILRFGQKFGVETPVTRSLYQSILSRTQA